MRQTGVLPMDGFFAIVSKEYGSSVMRNMLITQEEFASCIVKMEIGIDQVSAETLASEIAKMRADDKIDCMAFMDFMAEEEKDP